MKNVALPNILFIMMDDMGNGDLRCTGHPFIDTPNLDALALSGATFENFYAPASICSPSRASMLCGRMPYRLGIYSFIYYGGDYVHLRRNETTYSQILKEAGYQTALIGKWHVSHHDAREKFNLPSMAEYGYDYYFSSDNNTIIRNKPDWWENDRQIGVQEGFAANVVGDQTLDWLDNKRDPNKPFLLNVHFYEPHWFVEAPDSLVRKYKGHYASHRERAHYPACLENVDSEVGRIVESLKSLDLYDNTIVIFTSDNGPAHFADDRTHGRNDGRSLPYRGNKYGLWDGSMHVPGFIRWPGVTNPGQIIREPVGGVDFLPTLCAMAGVPVPEELMLDGIDFTPLFHGEEVDRTTPLQWHYYNSTLHDPDCPRAVLRSGDFVIAGRYDTNKAVGRGRWYPQHMRFLKNQRMVSFALYDIEKDPRQKTDIKSHLPALFKSMRLELENMHRRLQAEAYGWHSEYQKAIRMKN